MPKYNDKYDEFGNLKNSYRAKLEKEMEREAYNTYRECIIDPIMNNIRTEEEQRLEARFNFLRAHTSLSDEEIAIICVKDD